MSSPKTPKRNMKCRLCGASSKYQTVQSGSVYGGSSEHKFWHCSKCNIVYLYPPPSEKDEEKFYRDEFEKYMKTRSGSDTIKGWSSPEEHVRINQPEVERRLKFLKKYSNLKRPLNILEIGCSSGFMLSALKTMRHTVYGVEPSGVFTDFLASKRIPLFSSLDEIITSGITFDLIIHYYVLEHIREPADFLTQYMKVLSRGGKMIFEVPNVSDPLLSLYDIPDFNAFYWSIAHHWYFSPDSMSYLLNKVGCKFTFYLEQRYDLSNHMVWMQEGKPGGKGRYSETFSSRLDTLYKNNLIKSGHCDTLGVIARK